MNRDSASFSYTEYDRLRARIRALEFQISEIQSVRNVEAKTAQARIAALEAALGETLVYIDQDSETPTDQMNAWFAVLAGNAPVPFTSETTLPLSERVEQKIIDECFGAETSVEQAMREFEDGTGPLSAETNVKPHVYDNHCLCPNCNAAKTKGDAP